MQEEIDMSPFFMDGVLNKSHPDRVQRVKFDKEAKESGKKIQLTLGFFSMLLERKVENKISF
jgi:hypothetical protein